MDLINISSAIVTAIFFFVVLSYYILLFIKVQKPAHHRQFKSMSIIIPAHNEEPYIKECLESVTKAEFKGTKEIVVVDDGSIDSTSKIVTDFINKNKQHNIRLIISKHSGKSASINKALKVSTGDLIAIVDADSIIYEDALEEMAKDMSRRKVGAACGVIKVKNRSKHILMWIHIEQLYNSLMRSIFSKVNANVTTPGPLSMYRRKALERIGGFSTEGFSEDIDITVRLIRAGYKVVFSEKSHAETNMPHDRIGFWRQRTRFAKGMINVLKRHLRLNNRLIDIYTLPLFLFNYVQAIVMGSITLYKVISGYNMYFLSQGVLFNEHVVKFFLGWFSIYGFINWMYNLAVGIEPMTLLSAFGVISTLLTYPLYFLAIFKYDRKLDWMHIIPLVLMAPFWLLIMVIYIICLPEVFKKEQYNIWKKNEA